MTRDEILRLEGRELDDALAALFGEHVCYRGSHRIWRDNFGVWREPPDLSTTWEGIDLIQEAMRAKGWRLELLGYLRGNFAARFMGEGHGESKLGPSVDADDAPRAVALAALLALEGA